MIKSLKIMLDIFELFDDFPMIPSRPTLCTPCIGNDVGMR